MNIHLRVAGITIRGRSFVYIVDMTVETRRQGMFAHQFKDGQVVIEFSREPAGCSMAAITKRPEIAHMDIILCVAGITIGRRTFNHIV